MSCETCRKSHLALIRLVWGWEEAGDQTSSHLEMVRYTPQQHPQVGLKPQQVWDKTKISSFWQNMYFLDSGVFLTTLVVFDGEIGIVQHLWDQPIVEVVSLDGVIFVHSTDGLDHLKSKGRDTKCWQPLAEALWSHSAFFVLFHMY